MRDTRANYGDELKAAISLPEHLSRKHFCTKCHVIGFM